MCVIHAGLNLVINNLNLYIQKNIHSTISVDFFRFFIDEDAYFINVDQRRPEPGLQLFFTMR